MQSQYWAEAPKRNEWIELKTIYTMNPVGKSTVRLTKYETIGLMLVWYMNEWCGKNGYRQKNCDRLNPHREKEGCKWIGFHVCMYIVHVQLNVSLFKTETNSIQKLFNTHVEAYMNLLFVERYFFAWVIFLGCALICVGIFFRFISSDVYHIMYCHNNKHTPLSCKPW